MLLCLDVGNTHMYGGLFDNDQLSYPFRYPSKQSTSDELGIFFKNYLREIGVGAQSVRHVAYCSVVPSLDYSIRSAFVKYFSIEPFVLKAGALSDVLIQYKNTREIGADRIANTIAATHHFPKQNIIVVDMGTTTNLEVISTEGSFLGGAILPGLQMQMRSLNENTAKLPPVQILKPKTALGQTTEHNIQSGLYYGQKGAIRALISAISDEVFEGQAPVVIGTGGFAYLFEDDQIFTVILPDLVLQGLRLAFQAKQ